MKSEKKLKSYEVFLEIANSISKLSLANRRQVGAVLVTSDGRIAGTGFNGTPHGVDNECEIDDITLPHVLHAELNAILNARTSELKDSTMFITLSPCVQCAAIILQKGIKTVVYDKPYRDSSGIDFLKKHHVEVLSNDDLITMINFKEVPSVCRNDDAKIITETGRNILHDVKNRFKD